MPPQSGFLSVFLWIWSVMPLCISAGTKQAFSSKWCFHFEILFSKGSRSPWKWKKFWFQVEPDQIVLVKPNTYLFCFSNWDRPYNILLLWVSLPTLCSCKVLTSLYHSCHYFTPFRQILLAGIGSETEIKGCHQPGLKWLSFSGLCERGVWIQSSFCTCPHYKLVGFLFPNGTGRDQQCSSASEVTRGTRLLCGFFIPGSQVVVVTSLVVWGSVKPCLISRSNVSQPFFPCLSNQC